MHAFVGVTLITVAVNVLIWVFLVSAMRDGDPRADLPGCYVAAAFLVFLLDVIALGIYLVL
jgi:hypothetical protein